MGQKKKHCSNSIFGYIFSIFSSCFGGTLRHPLCLFKKTKLFRHLEVTFNNVEQKKHPKKKAFNYRSVDIDNFLVFSLNMNNFSGTLLIDFF
jgi:hypothetical protein